MMFKSVVADRWTSSVTPYAIAELLPITDDSQGA